MTGICKLMSILVLACVAFTTPGEAAQKVLFDTGHNEPFRIKDTGPLQLSGLAEAIQAAGAEVGTIDQPFSDAALAEANALVISGAFSALHPGEIDAVVRFLERGGKVAIMLHIAPPMASLLSRLQVRYTNGVILEQQNVIDQDPLRFKVNRLSDHPVLQGMPDFSLYGAWGLVNSAATTRVVATTSQQAWIDLNKDKVQAEEETATFGVAVAGEVGKGEFIVFGDDAIFQNKFLEGNNKILAANLAGWLK